QLGSQSRKTLVGIIRREDLNAEITSCHEPKLCRYREVQLTEDTCAGLVGINRPTGLTFSGVCARSGMENFTGIRCASRSSR
ncbi:MAG: hypothetical protein K0Q60_1614, partial [Microvirga sp.]|nr:hypothetical protein [Microvirga sp.]